MNLTADHWQRALNLMDTAATLSASERDAWLNDITDREPAVAALLRKLLSAQRRVETGDLLATLPMQVPPIAPDTSVIGAQPGAHIGPFALSELVGHGGMGSVWRASYADGRVKRDVAIKLPALSNNPAAIASLSERFARERDFLAQLEHPNIARLYDTGVAATGQPYLAMEFVNGQPIDDYCDQQKLSIKARVALFLQVADAVDYAHRQLVLHRDLKPSNVLVDNNGQVRLLDFGVAKLLPSIPAATTNDLTEVVGAAITLAYAAPEQLGHGALSTATDVYALAVMLYRLLTGLSPYQPARDTRGALEDEVLNSTPSRACDRAYTLAALEARQTTTTALKKTLSGDLDVILNKALKKRTEDRYPTAAALAADLRAHLNKQPIQAHPDSVWYRGSRFVERNRVAVAATVLGALSLVTSTGVAVWQASVATASATRANKEASRAATVQKFLAGIFSAADPEHSKGASVTALEILQRGRELADKELANDPEALVQVLDQIGNIYYQLGIPEQTVAVRRRQAEVAATLNSGDKNVLTDAQIKLGFALGETDSVRDNADALPILQEALAGARRRGSDADRIALALAYIADRHRLELRHPDAQRHISESVQLVDGLTASPPRTLADIYSIAAAVARDQGRIQEARAFFEKTAAMNRNGQGHTIVEQIDTLSQFAQLEFEESNYLAALTQAIAVMVMAEKLPGDIGNNVAPIRRVAVLSALFAGDLNNAKRLSETLLPQEIQSTNPLRSGPARLVRARIAWLSDDLDSARQELNLSEAALAKNTLWTSRWQLAKSEVELRQHQPLAAYDRLIELLSQQRKNLATDHVELAPTLEWLGVAAARIGQVSDARQFFSESCRLRAQKRNETHPQRVRCEGYKTLVADNLTAADKQAALSTLAKKCAAGRADNLLLLTSLTAVQQHFSRTNRADLSATEFPILN